MTMCALWLTSCQGEPGWRLQGKKDGLAVELRWKGGNDLDLHIINPADVEIYFADPAADSRARFGIDSNSNCDRFTQDEVSESITWLSNDALEGQYQILVSYYQQCITANYPPVHFEIWVWENGRQHRYTGSATRERQTVWVTSLTYEYEIDEQ